MKKIKIFSLLLAGSLCFTACDDYLTETPKHSLTTDNAVLDYSGAKNAVVDFSCGSAYSTSYIYSTHNATVGDVTFEQRTTSASN